MADDTIETIPPTKKSNSLLPILLIVVVLPAISYAMVEFLLIPRLKEQLKAEQEHADDHTDEGLPAAVAHGGGGGGHGGHGGGAAVDPLSFELDDVVTNLAGALRTRYVKVSMKLLGEDPNFNALMDHYEAQLRDVSIGVFSNLTVEDIDRPGMKNVIRNDLLNAWETELGKRYVKKIYFSEFVIQ